MPGIDREEQRVIVVGAGVAGLACARALADAGRSVTVLERARGVGGRCATRRLDGQAFDFGVVFFHGRDPGFLAALDGVPATRLPGWPAVVQGAGRPCQPEAFAPGERRLAFREGVSAFPKHLARGLDVRTGVRVISFGLDGSRVRLDLEDDASFTAGTVVLALAAEQSLALLHASAEAAPVLSTARALLEMVRCQPCLALLAAYPHQDLEPLPWDVCYPAGSQVLQALVQDSAKRVSPQQRVMVYQAHPRWSHEHLGDDRWSDRVLDEAARILGPWAGDPCLLHPHRWLHARTDLGAELSAPVYLALPGGARLGLAGELFAPGGGVEAAWMSAQRLARRILAEENR
jgi:renalase